MKLSARMERLASKVTAGNRLADVGTDHGYIPIYLVKEKRIPSAIAMDVNKGPLERAKEHIQAYGLDTYISLRLSDGLEKLGPGEADTILVAGMGGPLTVKILKEGAHCLGTVQELILQPQSEIRLVREYLSDNGFCITQEDIVQEEGKYYPMMRAVRGHEPPMSEEELFFGRAKLQQSPRVLSGYLGLLLGKNKEIMGRLWEKDKGDSRRMAELARACSMIVRMREKIKEKL